MDTKKTRRPGGGRKSNAFKLLAAGFSVSCFDSVRQDRIWNKLLSSGDEAIVLGASKYLTDRLYGKAKEFKEVSGPEGGPIPLSLAIDL